jgi:hypothetical protein
MIGLRWWILIWYGIGLLGLVGLIMAINWGRQTAWRNADEILRGIGTIAVSAGMLLLLYRVEGGAGYSLLLGALIAFVLAFIVGREHEREEAHRSAEAHKSEEAHKTDDG